MDPAAATRWCKEENASPDACLVIEIKREAWTEEKLTPVLRVLSPDKKPWVIDVKTDTLNLCTV